MSLPRALRRWGAVLALAAVAAACGPDAAEHEAAREARQEAWSALAAADGRRDDAAKAAEQAAKNLAEAVRAELSSQAAQDAEGRLRWGGERARREAGKNEADAEFSRARMELVDAGRRYLDSERLLHAVSGEYGDPVQFDVWRARLAAHGSGQFSDAAPFGGWGLLFGSFGAALVLVGALRVAARPRSNEPPVPVRAPAPKVELPLLAGRYRLTHLIGRGGFGHVYEGDEPASGLRVAVKQMAPGLDQKSIEARNLYLREASTLSKLRHRGIVHFLEAVEQDGALYLIFEHVAGKTLQQVLAERRRLTWPDARGLFAEICETLAFAHDRGIVHRDLKPANIMLAAEGGVKLMDFGIARACWEDGGGGVVAGEGADWTARTQTLWGTPAYTCPEAKTGVVSPASDFFSIGVCMYEVLTGALPYGREGFSPKIIPSPARDLAPELPEGVSRLIARLIDADRAHRADSAAQLARELKSL